MDITWIKIKTQTFDDEKIQLIEAMPEGDTILIIWLKLLLQAGKCNLNGYILLAENLPFSTEMLSTIFRRPLQTVRFALKTLNDFGMIDIDCNNFISIPNWEKHQNTKGLELIREKARLRVAKFRQNQRGVTLQSRQSNALDKEKEIDKEKEYNKYSEQSSEIRLSKLLFSLMLKNNPKARTPNFQSWAIHIDRMKRIDNRTDEEIEGAIRWSQQDAFWLSNILSTEKLRKQFDKLYLASKRKDNGNNKGYIAEDILREASRIIFDDPDLKK